MSATPLGLAALERMVAEDLALMQYPARSWIEPRRTSEGREILDVLVVGGGQGGLAVAALLRRERVDNVLVVDDHDEDRAGPWLNFARMRTLRTPKHLTGPDLGLPSLTIQRWYEARHGAGTWAALGLVPRETWAEYLAWVRRMLGVPVRWQTRVVALEWAAAHGCLRARTHVPEGEGEILARRVVLATGIEGSGAWTVPAFLREAVPAHKRAHTYEAIDFTALAGQRIAVLGAGASAFDNAAVALEHGAASVDLFFRRPRLVDVNAYRWAEFVGFLKHVGDLPDADRWRFILQILRMGQLPPAETLRRAKLHPGFTLQPESPWQHVETVGDEIHVTTPRGTFTFDYVIAATGFVTDLSLRPELAAFEPAIVRWAERYAPPPGEEHADLARHPYLGPSFEFTPRDPEATPWIAHVYNYTFGCLLSLGFGGASISGMKYSVQRLVGGITRSFFLEDRERHFESLRAFDLREFPAELLEP